jgi:hypothetical protein
MVPIAAAAHVVRIGAGSLVHGASRVVPLSSCHDTPTGQRSQGMRPGVSRGRVRAGQCEPCFQLDPIDDS